MEAAKALHADPAALAPLAGQPDPGEGTALVIAAFLGLIQGLTEFLPVSSSGHLLLAQWLLGVDGGAFGLSFDAALHLGTVAAVLAYFRRDVAALTAAFFEGLLGRRANKDPLVRLAWCIVVGTVPAAVAGALAEKWIEEHVRSPFAVAAALAGFGLLLLWADRRGRSTAGLERLTLGRAVFVGLMQALALVPGVSRSGISITAGLLVGLDRAAATRFAFLLSAPITGGAGAKHLYDIAAGKGGGGALAPALVGLAVAAVSGYAVIWFLVRWVAGHRLDVFAYYRLALAGVVVVLALLGFGR